MNTQAKVYYRMVVKTMTSDNPRITKSRVGPFYITSYHGFNTHEEAQGFKHAMSITLDLHRFEWEMRPTHQVMRRNLMTYDNSVVESAEYWEAYKVAMDDGYYDESNGDRSFEDYEKAYNEGAKDAGEDCRTAYAQDAQDRMYDPQR